MKRILTMGYFLGLTLLGQAQETVTEGRIINQEGEPLIAATIQWQKKKAISDSLGFFRLAVPTKGKITLHISAIGYEPLDTVLVAGMNGDFKLSREVKVGEEVVITGTLRSVRRSESPVAVEIFTPQFFKRNPAPSIFEALQQVNGVRPQLNCNVCNTGDIHINGLEGPYTMVTIDGMPIVSSLASVYGLFGIPVQLIDRVEIVKGPASGLYGSEAIGGLINIITRQPEKAPRWAIDGMTSSWKEQQWDIGSRFRIGKKASQLLGINYYRYQHPVDNNKDGFTDLTLQHRVSIFSKLSFVRKLNREAHLAGRYFYEDRWGGQMNWTPAFRGTDSIYGESIYTNRWELIGKYQLPVPGNWNFSFSGTGHRQNSYYGTTPYFARQHIGFGQLLGHLKLAPRHETLLGLALRYNRYDDNSTATRDTLTGINRPDSYLLPGLFLQDEWDLQNRKTLLTGIRFDHHPIHGIVFTPRVAFKWGLGERTVLRLNAGTGFRVVNLFTEEHAALTGARVVEILEALKPERSMNVNANLTNRWKWGLHHFSTDISSWYSYFNNQILPDYDTDPNKIIYQNMKGHSRSVGMTLNLEWNWANRFRLQTGLTLQDVARYEQINGKQSKQPLVLTEKWSSTWSASYTFSNARWVLDYTGNLYGPMRLPLLSSLDPRPAMSPVWGLQNLQLTWKAGKRIEVYGGVKNLFDWTPDKATPFLIARANDPFDKQVSYDSEGKILATPDNPYALSFDPSYVFAPNQGRRGFLGLRFTVQ